ncbi:MAG: invasion associated locus B family protein [Pseudomonadota bacterium]
MVTAMKAGSTMVVQGRSTRGTLTTDEYSLSGITKALDAVTKACQ